MPKNDEVKTKSFYRKRYWVILRAQYHTWLTSTTKKLRLLKQAVQHMKACKQDFHISSIWWPNSSWLLSNWLWSATLAAGTGSFLPPFACFHCNPTIKSVNSRTKLVKKSPIVPQFPYSVPNFPTPPHSFPPHHLTSPPHRPTRTQNADYLADCTSMRDGFSFTTQLQVKAELQAWSLRQRTCASIFFHHQRLISFSQFLPSLCWPLRSESRCR